MSGSGKDTATTPNPPESREQPICAMCGKPIAADDLVCPHCGTKLVSG